MCRNLVHCRPTGLWPPCQLRDKCERLHCRWSNRGSFTWSKVRRNRVDCEWFKSPSFDPRRLSLGFHAPDGPTWLRPIVRCNRIANVSTWNWVTDIKIIKTDRTQGIGILQAAMHFKWCFFHFHEFIRQFLLCNSRLICEFHYILHLGYFTYHNV